MSVNADGMVPGRRAKADGILFTNIATTTTMHAERDRIWMYRLGLVADSLIPELSLLLVEVEEMLPV